MMVDRPYRSVNVEGAVEEGVNKVCLSSSSVDSLGNQQRARTFGNVNAESNLRLDLCSGNFSFS